MATFEKPGFLTIICLVVVHISSAQLAENIQCAILEKVFTSCKCRAAAVTVKAIVDCSNMGLTAVPTIGKSHDTVFYKLILANNSITTLSDNSFQGLKMEHLDLSGNRLTTLDNNTFVSMKDSLRTLEIDGDSTSVPPINALRKLEIIESLTMRHYNVPFIDQGHKFFLSFDNLKSLTLDDWKTEHIESSSFLGLHSLQSLTLLNQKMENLPIDALTDDPFDKLETLHISNSLINKVTHSVFNKLSKLKNLDLSNNQIEDLQSNCFLGVGDTLQNINLRNNLLNNENEKLKGMSGLQALEHLDLSYNTFKKIPTMLNLGATKPFTLHLQDNEIDQVLENAFNGYAHYVSELDLTGNYIRNMHYKSFDGVTQLTSLDVHSQKGTDSSAVYLPISLTNSKSTLHSIDLSGQKVDPNSLWEVIGQLTSLNTLNLNSCELSNIPDNTFQRLTALERLHLSYNSLSELSQESLVGLRKLKRLDLEGNNIKTIPSCLFYGFDSPEITLTLGQNPIKCDCKIRKLLEGYKNGKIVFDPLSLQPTCFEDNELLTNKQPETLVCKAPFEEQPCTNYYSTPAPPVTSEPVTDSETPKLHLQILEVGITTIKASWTITDGKELRKYKFQVTSSGGVVEFTRDNLQASVNVFEATGLPADTHVTACVTASFQNRPPLVQCRVNETLSKNGNNAGNTGSDSGSADTAIIVGTAVAGVALIGVVIAIVILLVFRKKPKKVPDNYTAPTQPRNFAKAELPSMTEETRRFAKPKKNGKSPHHDSMQVVAISDGQTSPGARVGRANMMFQPEDGYEPMNNFKFKNESKGSLYENDHGALPPTPSQDIRPPSYPSDRGYYNQAFRGDKYDEVEI